MADNSKTVVLVADDEPSTLAMLASHLRAKGYTVLEASDGDQAWELAHEHLPHLVVLDVMMPGMSGWEVCRKIREAVSLAHTGVVMLTGIGENLNEMTSPLYGADAHVDKPFEFADLDRKMRETLEKRRAGALGRPDEEESRVALGWDELASSKNGQAPEQLESSPRPVAKARPPKPSVKPASNPTRRKPYVKLSEQAPPAPAAKAKKKAKRQKAKPPQPKAAKKPAKAAGKKAQKAAAKPKKAAAKPKKAAAKPKKAAAKPKKAAAKPKKTAKASSRSAARKTRKA